MTNHLSRSIIAALAAASLAGCASTGARQGEPEIAGRDSQISELEAKVQRQNADLAAKRTRIAELEKASPTDVAAAPPPLLASQVGGAGDLFPASAKPGECYARVLVPSTFETRQETVLKRAASERFEVIQAFYKEAEEKVLVKPASEKLEVVPGTFEWVEERVLVKPASSNIVQVSAEFEWVEEKVLETPAHTVWKEGRGPIERVDHSTGEILCLVEVPATYKTVRKRVLKSPASVREIPIAAEYDTVRKRVQKTPPTTRTITIPAEYQTVKVRKIVAPAASRRIEIPAEYQTVTHRQKVTDERMEWRPTLCQTNVSPQLVTKLQSALDAAGHDPGPIDGVIGKQTMAAVHSFQRAKGLPTGNLTIATLEALPADVRR